MNTIMTSSGRLHHLNGDGVWNECNVPTGPEIAHSLAQINRFTGHARRPYSVAEHSLLVADIAVAEFGLRGNPAAVLAALLHDAHECVTGDAASPIKRTLGPAWERFEGAQQDALRIGYGLDQAYKDHAAAIKACDLIALATERRDLMPWRADRHEPWEVLDKAGAVVRPWPHARLDAWWRQCAPWWFWRWQMKLCIDGLLDEWAEVREEAAA